MEGESSRANWMKEKRRRDPTATKPPSLILICQLSATHLDPSRSAHATRRMCHHDMTQRSIGEETFMPRQSRFGNWTGPLPAHVQIPEMAVPSSRQSGRLPPGKGGKTDGAEWSRDEEANGAWRNSRFFLWPSDLHTAVCRKPYMPVSALPPSPPCASASRCCDGPSLSWQRVHAP